MWRSEQIDNVSMDRPWSFAVAIAVFYNYHGYGDVHNHHNDGAVISSFYSGMGVTWMLY